MHLGYTRAYPTNEDILYAECAKNELEKISIDREAMANIKTRKWSSFFRPCKQSRSPHSHFELCMDLNRFDFIFKVEKENELNYLRKIEI